jgi:hypothetical protein
MTQDADHWYKRIFDCISLTEGGQDVKISEYEHATTQGGFTVDAPKLYGIIREMTAPQVLPEDRKRALAALNEVRYINRGSNPVGATCTMLLHLNEYETIRSCLSCVDDYTLPDDDAWINMIFGCAPDYAGVLLLPSERSPSGFGNDRHVLADIGKLYLERLNRQRESAINQITETEVK